MLTLRDPEAVQRVGESSIRVLLTQRFEEISQGENYDPDNMGYFVLVQADDTIAQLEEAHGVWITSSLFDDSRFGDADFSPCFECLVSHADCYEMVFILNDDGFSVVLIVPRFVEIDSALREFCQHYARPAPELCSE
jgi:hypothetical protein